VVQGFEIRSAPGGFSVANFKFTTLGGVYIQKMPWRKCWFSVPPERSVLQLREHRKYGKAAFADRQG